MAKAKDTGASQARPRFLEELQRREHEQTPEGRDDAAEADAAVAELTARFSNTPERREAIVRAMRRFIS
jgi:hypothetical protein